MEAPHVEYARKSNVKTLTLVQFRSRFFDGRDYIAKRKMASFGSARNLEDGSISIRGDEYVELPMTVVDVSSSGMTSHERTIDLEGVIQLLLDGELVVLLGPFGAGKSLTTREIFLKVAHKYLADQIPCVPLALNLREHWGAEYADEILERHARSVGLARRETLTIAWRAGMALLLLDGFDELAAQAIAKPTDKSFMRQAREQSLLAVREMVSKSQPNTGILLCGRDHYFDNLEEMKRSLSLNRVFFQVRLGEFTEEQAGEFLKRHARSTALPDWLPRKPLILGYLAHRNLLESVLAIDGSRGFGYAWDSFLDLVCKREAEHERSSMDPRTPRRVLERLACAVRGTATGTGPITGLDLSEAYRSETGDSAGESVIMQLQRLPGLTPREQDPSARSFVDPDMLAALQGSAVARAIVENSSELSERRWILGLTRNGIEMAAYKLESAGYASATVIATANRLATSAQAGPRERQLAADCFCVAGELVRDTNVLDGRGLTLSESHIYEIDLEELAISDITLTECAIESVIVGEALSRSTIAFDRCLIQQVKGVQAAEALPATKFWGCEVEHFDEADTNAAVLRLPIPDLLKVLSTILRKLYVQAGGGRKISALRKGLASDRMSGLVGPILGVLKSEGMVSVTSEIVHPIRRQTSRVLKILSGVAVSDDPLVAKVRELR